MGKDPSAVQYGLRRWRGKEFRSSTPVVIFIWLCRKFRSFKDTCQVLESSPNSLAVLVFLNFGRYHLQCMDKF